MRYIIFTLAVLVSCLHAARSVQPVIITLGFVAALMIVRAEQTRK